MNQMLRSLRCFSVLGLVFTLLSVAAAGQNRSDSSSSSREKPKRTAWGDPDLQGLWTNTTTTPLERPVDLANSATLTAAERAALDAKAAAAADRVPKPGETGAYNDFWFERGKHSMQTSLIVDPPNGRLPPLTAVGEAEKKRLLVVREEDGGRLPTSYEDFDTYDRCITRALPGAMMPGFYNHNYRIFQTPQYVAIQIEMIHDVRIIPIDGRPHTSQRIRQWLGDSRGRWEGDTLVVETKNFREGAQERGMANTVVGGSPDMVLVERFKRVGADGIDYKFTVTDSTVFTAPWTVSAPMTTLSGAIYEYACHEGNYAMTNILKGANAAREAAGGSKPPDAPKK
jgi:hypothetical protein